MKNNLKLGVVFAFLLVFFSWPIHASLINNYSFFTDTDTKLDWIHLDYTINMSYNDVKASLQSGGQLEGWRFATKNDISTLFSNAGSSFNKSEEQPHGGYLESGFSILSPLWGLTYSASTDILTEHNRVSFMFDGGYSEINFWAADFAWMGYINVNDNIGRSSSYPFDEYFYIGYNELSGHTIGRTQAHESIASALVRVSQVPLPSTLWLFATCLFFLRYLHRSI